VQRKKNLTGFKNLSGFQYKRASIKVVEDRQPAIAFTRLFRRVLGGEF
jgi:hypothetical protein